MLLLIDHLGTGGVQEHVYQLCQHFRGRPLDVSVCALHSAGHYAERIARLGVPVQVLAPGRSALRLPGVVWRLARLLGSGGYAALHTFLEASFSLGTPLARRAGIPTLHSITSVRAQLAPWYLALLVRMQRWVDIYLSGVERSRVKLSETQLDLAEPLAVVRDRGHPLAGLDIPDAAPLALSVGRLIPDKGHEHAIRAWPRVVARFPEAVLLVVGDGADEARLRQLAAHCGVAERVRLTGYRSDLMDLFARADLFLRTSVVEGMNMVTSQAMAAGLPVVAFSTHVRKDFVVHGHSGWAVPLADAGALAEGILQLLGDPDLAARLGRTAREGIRSYFDAERVLGTHERLYLALARGERIEGVPDMRDQMWPACDPFLAARKRCGPDGAAGSGS